MLINVRELQLEDITLVADYWQSLTAEQSAAMAADIAKLPSREEFTAMITGQLSLPYSEKNGYALIWEIDGVPIGHSNINQITFGEQATMHLHIWDSAKRQNGVGQTCVAKSIPFYFTNFQLRTLVCEPYALNPAPNKTLVRVGFQFDKKYHTVPGSINFEQEVNRYTMTRSQFENLPHQ